MSVLPWTGVMDLPPGGVNHAYMPVMRRKRDGSAGIGFAKIRGYDVWAEAAAWSLRAQGIPRLPAGTPLAVLLQQRFRTMRQDTDSVAKACLDALATAISMADGPPWDDRDCALLVLAKAVDKANPGVRVTLASFEAADPAASYRALLVAFEVPQGV